MLNEWRADGRVVWVGRGPEGPFRAGVYERTVHT